jgi:hypothetical protein
MEAVVKITVDNFTNKPSVIVVKFDEYQAGTISIERLSNTFARENRAVPIQPVLARIKVRPGKQPSSPEIQRLQSH